MTPFITIGKTAATTFPDDTFKRLKETKLYENYLEAKEKYHGLSQDFVSDNI
jgi:hypothetical protein